MLGDLTETFQIMVKPAEDGWMEAATQQIRLLGQLFHVLHLRNNQVVPSELPSDALETASRLTALAFGL